MNEDVMLEKYQEFRNVRCKPGQAVDMVLTTIVDLAKTCKDQGVILRGNGDGSVRLERSAYYKEFL